MRGRAPTGQCYQIESEGRVTKTRGFSIPRSHCYTLIRAIDVKTADLQDL